MTTATITYRNGRKRELNVHAEFKDGSLWAVPGRTNAWIGYLLDANGMVYKHRYSSRRGREGELLSSTPVDATWAAG